MRVENIPPCGFLSLLAEWRLEAANEIGGKNDFLQKPLHCIDKCGTLIIGNQMNGPYKLADWGERLYATTENCLRYGQLALYPFG